MRLDVKENVVFPFSDPEWAIKLFKTSLSYLLVVTSPAVVGYQLAVVREAANGEDERLPEFGPDFGAMWVKGFVFCLVAGLIAMVPTMSVGALTFGAAWSMSDNTTMAMGVAAVGGITLMAICFALAVFMPALMLRYAMTGNVSSLFDIGSAVSDIKQGPSDYAIIVLFPILASFVSGLVSLTGVGAILVLPITVLTLMIQGRMLGNYYRAYFD